jgi:hypothetical protein
MFVVFRADAYFSMGGEVLLYFIVRVEVIKIQIWIEFKLVWNLEKIWKFKRLFPVFIWPWAEFDPASPAKPASASLAHGPGAAQRRSSPSRHRDGNAAGWNLNEIERSVESQLNLRAWTYSPTHAWDYQPETPINRGKLRQDFKENRDKP